MGNTAMTSADIPAPTPALAPVGSGVSRRFRMGRTISALMLREMASRYGRSPGGYVWAVLEPLGMIVFLSIGFSLVVRTPAMGTSFILFFATGFVPFNLYNAVVSPIARTLTYSSGLLSYPVITWVDALFARFALNSVTGITVAYLIMAMIVATLENPILLNIPPTMGALSLAAVLALGIGTLNCALFGMVAIWDKFWTILTRPLFLASGVILRYEDMPEKLQNILWYNPLLHITGYMREGFYPTYEATYVSPLYVLFIAMVTLFLGIVLLRRYHRQILTN
jgi:capsular polysaccharide transport system permease protein